MDHDGLRTLWEALGMTEPFLECWPWPDGTPITQEFGDMFSGYPHRGRDGGTTNGTPIVPGAAGIVVEFVNSWTTWNGQSVRSFGNAVCIDFGNGLFGLYAHMSRVDVSVGNHVTARQIIGLSGNTGVSTGPHLHQQLCIDTRFSTDISQSRDPRDYIILEGDDMDRWKIIRLADGPYPAMHEAYQGMGASGWFDEWIAGDGVPADPIAERECLRWLAAGPLASEAVKALKL